MAHDSAHTRLKVKAGVSCACVPSMVSCSSFGFPMHAQLLRLFVTKDIQLKPRRLGGTRVIVQTTAGKFNRHTPRRRAGQRVRTNNVRTGTHEQGPKQLAGTRNTPTRRKQTKQHTWHPTVQPNKSMRTHPDTRERSNRSIAPTATSEAPGEPSKRYLAPGRHRQSQRHTNDTSRTSP